MNNNVMMANNNLQNENNEKILKTKKVSIIASLLVVLMAFFAFLIAIIIQTDNRNQVELSYLNSSNITNIAHITGYKPIIIDISNPSKHLVTDLNLNMTIFEATDGSSWTKIDDAEISFFQTNTIINANIFLAKPGKRSLKLETSYLNSNNHIVNYIEVNVFIGMPTSMVGSIISSSKQLYYNESFSMAYTFTDAYGNNCINSQFVDLTGQALNFRYQSNSIYGSEYSKSLNTYGVINYKTKQVEYRDLNITKDIYDFYSTGEIGFQIDLTNKLPTETTTFYDGAVYNIKPKSQPIDE
jgi:hypothetical protein